MRLTKEKLQNAWRLRNQIFDNPVNAKIIKRYNDVTALFEKIGKYKIDRKDERRVWLDGKEILLNNGKQPSHLYFACKEDDMTAGRAFEGINIMCQKLPEEYSDVIVRIGCLLGGFSFSESHTMKDEYRIISNTVTGSNDNGTLNSVGQSRHPSSHFADNNYFFNVIDTINNIRENKFDCSSSKLVLRWPNPAYYANDIDAETAQRDVLRCRFPYKYFYMWTHEVLHPVSLMAYRNLVQQEDSSMAYIKDKDLNQNFEAFAGQQDWKSYSDKIQNMIPEEERGDDFWNEMSKLLSVLMIQDQQIHDARELLRSGNQAVILYGPPGTGKTYSAKNMVCNELGISNDIIEKYKFDEDNPVPDKGAWALVQFHPNYTYEDFIGGISPDLRSGTLSYTLKVGIFKKLCDTANKEENRGKKFFIIVDEINRADLSSVFGELMYALEYRNELISIPNFPEKFCIPSNVYIIGTMNSIDKSLVTFDLALRRRFGFIKIMPRLSVLENILSDYNIEDECLTKFIKRCEGINNRIAESDNDGLKLGEDYKIGHAYYGKIKDFIQKTETTQNITIFDLEKLWDYHIQPLLEEYLGNRIEDKNVKKSLEKLKNEFTKPLV